MEDCTVTQTCRMCGERDLQPVISFGRVPLSNAFLNKPGDPEELFPLSVVFCPRCTLVQLAETVSPTRLFSEYSYFSSVSAGMLGHARELASIVTKLKVLGKDSLVMEIASNDGYLLQYFSGIPVLGIDPAENIAKIANDNGIPTKVEFFGREMAKELPQADIVFALNVLGHVADLTGFVDGIEIVLKPKGVAIIEVPYVRDMVESCDASTIYFEHLYYFSVTALVNLFKTHGLQVVKAERIPIHCGSLRLYVTHPNGGAPADRYGLEDLLYMEERLGVDRTYYYSNFSREVQRTLTDLRGILAEKARRGERIVGFGAAAKGTMLLNFLRAGVEVVDSVVDETPAKQGKFMPGTHQRIVPPGEIGRVDTALLLAYNWEKEFISRFPTLATRWLIPFPRLHTA